MSTGGETHAVSPDPANSPASQSSGSADDGKSSPLGTPHSVSSRTAQSTPAESSASTATARSSGEQESSAAEADAAPSGHNTYLQVAALKQADALTVAKVLSKKGFHAHISPKAGTSFYRVLVGPVHDAGELNSTRAALKNKGFREVFVQHL